MRKSTFVRFAVGLVAAQWLFGASMAETPAKARDATYAFDIPAQRLNDALQALALASKHELLYSAKLVDGMTSAPLKGQYTTEEAVKQLLAGTDLTYEITSEGLVVIKSGQSNDLSLSTAEEQGIGGRMRLVQADEAQGSPAAGAETGPQLEEIVVTAQKRQERLLEVPQSVTVLSAEELAKNGILQFRDFANTIPGLTFSTAGGGSTQVSLRGVTAGRDIGPTVGIYVDEVPYGASTNFASASLFALDVGLFDLDRVEVLRGPQGTLYGASTMGGLIKYVTKQPDSTSFNVNLQTGISNTRGGRENYHGAATVNAPIVTNKAAVRASGFYSRDGGYIDNLALGESDVNRSDIYGGRADLLILPSERIGIRLTAFLQDIAREGEGTADYDFSGFPLDGSLDQRRPLAEPFDQRFRLVGGTITYDLSGATLTSISSYQTAETELIYDYSRSFTPFCSFIGRSCSAVGLLNEIATDKFVQEVRLASQGTNVLDWLIGGYYNHEKSEILAEFVLRGLAAEPLPNDFGGISSPSRYDEYAVFGDLTWHLSRRFDVSGGVRFSQNRQTFEQLGFGLFGLSTPARRSTDDVLTYLANARYHFDDQAIAYLRYATGYKPGGPNFVVDDPTTGLPIGPETFEADRLKSYEVGYKAETVDRRFGVDVAAYYIDWNNIQISFSSGGFAGVDNAPGGASIRGAELVLTSRPAQAFTVMGAFAYQDATMSQADPNLLAAKGERLPNVPRVTAVLSADYELRGASLRPKIGATVRYVDDRMSSFDSSINFRQSRLPDYTTVDFRTGLMIGSIDAQLYVRNLFDERGQLSAFNGRGVAMPAILQPRTIGVTATTRF